MMNRFKGFMQIYQLQTENDEEETWKDLVRDRSMEGVKKNGLLILVISLSPAMALIGP
jgi:hypothetical protein